MPKIPTLPHQPKPAPYRYPPVSKLDTANAQLLLHPNDFAVSPRGRTVLAMRPVANESKASKEGTGECKCTGSETVVYCFECHEYIPKASEIQHTCFYLDREKKFHEMWCCKDFNRNQDFGAHAHPIQAAQHLEYLKWAYFGGPMPPWVQARLRNRMKAAPAATPIPARLTANAKAPHVSPQQASTARPTPVSVRGLSPVGWNPSPSPAPVAGPSNAAHVQAPPVAMPAAPVPQQQLNEAQQEELEQMMFAAMDEYATKAAHEQQEQQAVWAAYGQQDHSAQPQLASSMQPSNAPRASGGLSPSPFVQEAFTGSSLQASVPQHLLDQAQHASPHATWTGQAPTPTIPPSTPHQQNRAAQPQLQFADTYQAYDDASPSTALAGYQMQDASPQTTWAAQTLTPDVPSNTPRPQSSAAQAQASSNTGYEQAPIPGPSSATPPVPQQTQNLLQHVQPLRRYATWTAQEAPSPAQDDMYPSAPLAASSSTTPPVPSQNQRQQALPALGRYATWTAQEGAQRACSPAAPVRIARSTNATRTTPGARTVHNQGQRVASGLGRHATWVAPQNMSQVSAGIPRAQSRAAQPMPSASNQSGPSRTPQPYGSLSPSPLPVAGSSGTGQQVAAVAQQQQDQGQRAPTAFGRHATRGAPQKMPQIPSDMPQQQQQQQSRTAQPPAAVQNGLAKRHHPQTYLDLQEYSNAHASPSAQPSSLSAFPPLAQQPPLPPSTQHHVPRPGRASFGQSRTVKPASLDLTGLSATARVEQLEALRAQVAQIMGALRCDQQEALRVIREVRKGVPAS